MKSELIYRETKITDNMRLNPINTADDSAVVVEDSVVVVVDAVVVDAVVVVVDSVVVDSVVVVAVNKFWFTAWIGSLSFSVVSTTVASPATMVPWNSSAVSSDVTWIKSSTMASLCLLRRWLAMAWYAHLK
jgi:hypothetical protein